MLHGIMGCIMHGAHEEGRAVCLLCSRFKAWHTGLPACLPVAHQAEILSFISTPFQMKLEGDLKSVGATLIAGIGRSPSDTVVGPFRKEEECRP